MKNVIQSHLNSFLVLTLLLLLPSCFESSSDSTPTTTTPTVNSPSTPLQADAYDNFTPLSSDTPIVQLVANCNNGFDDDGDGLVDWQQDLGCSGPNDNEIAQSRVNENGWTTFDPHPTETEIIYVSNTLGNDSYSGFESEWTTGNNGPVKTIAAALALIRDNSADWILFRRGDEWLDETIGQGLEDISGISPENPIVIASYGTSTERPKFNFSGSDWFSPVNGTPENISILGLELNQYNLDPNDPYFNPNSRGSAIHWVATGGNFLLEDCKINYAQVNLLKYNSPTGYFEIRRNILTNSYSIGGHAQSIFTNIHVPILIEENIINHGGWNNDFRLVLTAPQTIIATWNSITNGCFDIKLADNLFQISGVDFSAAADMNTVIQILETEVNAAILAISGQANTVTINFSLGEAIKIASTDFPSDDAYSVSAYTGGAGGTDISGSSYLNATASGVPESTMFNRNMYLSHGLGNTIVRGNIDANGASGGIQLRMGGIIDNNLFLQNPISITVGSAENDAANVYARIKNNVILGSRNIDTQRQGTGIFISSNLEHNGYGPSWIEDVKVYNNIIAHGTSITQFNIKGVSIAGDGPHIDLNIHHNIIYNWTNPSWTDPNDHRAYGFIVGNLNPATSHSFFQDNIIQQVTSGFVGKSISTPPLTITNNTYYSAENNPPTIWSAGWFEINSSVSSNEWSTETNETLNIADPPILHPFHDPTRTIASYHQIVCGGAASFDAFITQALLQSRLNWNNKYTANNVNTWIREGFDLTYEE